MGWIRAPADVLGKHWAEIIVLNLPSLQQLQRCYFPCFLNERHREINKKRPNGGFKSHPQEVNFTLWSTDLDLPNLVSEHEKNGLRRSPGGISTLFLVMEFWGWISYFHQNPGTRLNKFKQSNDYLQSGMDAAAVRGATDHHFCVGRVTNIPTSPTFEKCHSVIILHLKKRWLDIFVLWTSSENIGLFAE